MKKVDNTLKGHYYIIIIIRDTVIFGDTRQASGSLNAIILNWMYGIFFISFLYDFRTRFYLSLCKLKEWQTNEMKLIDLFIFCRIRNWHVSYHYESWLINRFNINGYFYT